MAFLLLALASCAASTGVYANLDSRSLRYLASNAAGRQPGAKLAAARKPQQGVAATKTNTKKSSEPWQALPAADKARPQKQLRSTQSRDFYDQLVDVPASKALRVKKEAVLPASMYLTEGFDIEPFETWLAETLLQRKQPLSQPPISFRCGVYFNFDYRIILIRSRKAASTSLLYALNRVLGCSPKRPRQCMMQDEFPEFERNHDEVWRNWTVSICTPHRPQHLRPSRAQGARP